ncbi:unnamed protein product [Medioppia subpectinata]|uniref:Uncharacterized protein n=1 Tax=Medioppia subpectinata TaxID=1979941 RepID=A0A7R9KSD1_9ACAR|nr:unnamed protein product [Medioppia subpectinata]CAG2108941.1 unnamed protein product [Medioppia subpectinata]
MLKLGTIAALVCLASAGLNPFGLMGGLVHNTLTGANQAVHQGLDFAGKHADIQTDLADGIAGKMLGKDNIIQKVLGSANQAVHRGLDFAGRVEDTKTRLADNLFNGFSNQLPQHLPIELPSHTTDNDAEYYQVKNSRDFTGKVVLITVSNSGLAEGTIKLFSILGANLVITGTNATHLAEIAQLAQQQSPTRSNQPLRVVADLTKTADIGRLVGEIVYKFGRLDAMITFANSYPLLNITDPNLMDVWDQTLRADLRATAELFHLTYPLLEKARGSATVVATIAGVAPVAVELAYSTAKAGVQHMVKNLALELGAKGVRVNTINIGAITPDGTNLGNPVLALMEKKAPLGHLGVPLDVAKGAVFLSSSDAKYITGANLVIDGGIIYTRHISNNLTM